MGDFFVQITKLFSHPPRNYCPYKMHLEIGLINISLIYLGLLELFPNHFHVSPLYEESVSRQEGTNAHKMESR